MGLIEVHDSRPVLRISLHPLCLQSSFDLCLVDNPTVLNPTTHSVRLVSSHRLDDNIFLDVNAFALWTALAYVNGLEVVSLCILEDLLGRCV